MLAKERLHEDAYRIRQIVFTKSLDARKLKGFFFLDIVFLKRRLLQNIHYDFERLVHLAAQPIDNVPEEICLIHNVNPRTGILQPPGNVFGVEALRSSDCGAKHEFGYARVL